MAPIKSPFRMDVSVDGPRPAASEKTAPPQYDRPAKPAIRRVPKSLRSRVVGDAPPASAPAVILWDDPVDPHPDPKLKI